MPLPGFPAGWGLSVHLREVPLRTRADALALFPRWFRETDDPIRDVMADAWVEAFAKFASKQAARAAEANDAYATGSNLDLRGAQKEMPRALGEGDEPYRARLLSAEDCASPRAILAAVDRITARVTTKLATYYELPDDRAFVRSKVHGEPRGFFPGAKHPIRRPARIYAKRGRCEPKTVIFFRRRRSTFAAALDPHQTDGNARIAYNSDDYNGAGNDHGRAILCLPAFLQPGRSKKSAPFIFRKLTGALIDEAGSLLPFTVAHARVARFVFRKATLVSRHGAGLPIGPAVRARANAAEFIVAEIKALLASRASFGSKTTLLYDPKL
jgi:hypothetical protein